MAHPDHDAIVGAFKQADPRVSCCHRGGPSGYTHIHGPSHARHPTRCRNHCVAVEKQNGTVALRRDLALQMGALARPNLAISRHPLGHSHRPDYGEFDHALDVPTIKQKWPTLANFARDVIARCTQIYGW